MPGGTLPADLRVAIIPGRNETVVQVDADHASPELCQALTDAVTDFVDSEWMYVGDLRVMADD